MTSVNDRNAAEADLASVRFRAGVLRRCWRAVSFEFPILIVGVAAINSGCEISEYLFRFELTGFPTVAPEVIIWDIEAGAKLAADRRPKGSHRVVEAFKDWTVPHSVYRPWDRHGAAHNNWAHTHPDLAWCASRDLTFILEDLHGLLTSSAAAHNPGQAA